MKVALCLVDGHEWIAHELEKIRPYRLRALGKELACIGCGARALLERSNSRRAARFVAEHQPACPALIASGTAFRFLQ